MINSLDTYREYGQRVARARNQGDEARAKSEAEYMRKMKALEKPDDRLAADAAYRAAYSDARNSVS